MPWFLTNEDNSASSCRGTRNLWAFSRLFRLKSGLGVLFVYLYVHVVRYVGLGWRVLKGIAKSASENTIRFWKLCRKMPKFGTPDPWTFFFFCQFPLWHGLHTNSNGLLPTICARSVTGRVCTGDKSETLHKRCGMNGKLKMTSFETKMRSDLMTPILYHIRREVALCKSSDSEASVVNHVRGRIAAGKGNSAELPVPGWQPWGHKFSI